MSAKGNGVFFVRATLEAKGLVLTLKLHASNGFSYGKALDFQSALHLEETKKLLSSDLKFIRGQAAQFSGDTLVSIGSRAFLSILDNCLTLGKENAEKKERANGQAERVKERNDKRAKERQELVEVRLENKALREKLQAAIMKQLKEPVVVEDARDSTPLGDSEV